MCTYVPSLNFKIGLFAYLRIGKAMSLSVF